MALKTCYVEGTNLIISYTSDKKFADTAYYAAVILLLESLWN